MRRQAEVMCQIIETVKFSKDIMLRFLLKTLPYVEKEQTGIRSPDLFLLLYCCWSHFTGTML